MSFKNDGKTEGTGTETESQTKKSFTVKKKGGGGDNGEERHVDANLCMRSHFVKTY